MRSMKFKRSKKIDKDNWYYEEKSGIDIIHQVRDSNGAYLKTDFIKIPWRMLIASLEKKRKCKNAKA